MNAHGVETIWVCRIVPHHDRFITDDIMDSGKQSRPSCQHRISESSKVCMDPDMK